MQKIKSFFAREKFLYICKWICFILIGLFVLLVLVRAFYLYTLDKTNAEVAKIHATKLSLRDVTGENLPPEPGSEKDATIAGIDANKNGIRDDVELAIFREYLNSAKTRAALLQYALALQMEFSEPIVNKETVTAIIEDSDTRALNCIWSTSSRENMQAFITETDKKENFVKQLQVNTDKRILYLHNFYEHLGSYSASKRGCDLDLATLSN